MCVLGQGAVSFWMAWDSCDTRPLSAETLAPWAHIHGIREFCWGYLQVMATGTYSLCQGVPLALTPENQSRSGRNTKTAAGFLFPKRPSKRRRIRIPVPILASRMFQESACPLLSLHQPHLNAAWAWREPQNGRRPTGSAGSLAPHDQRMTSDGKRTGYADRGATPAARIGQLLCNVQVQMPGLTSPFPFFLSRKP